MKEAAKKSLQSAVAAVGAAAVVEAGKGFFVPAATFLAAGDVGSGLLAAGAAVGEIAANALGDNASAKVVEAFRRVTGPEGTELQRASAAALRRALGELRTDDEEERTFFDLWESRLARAEKEKNYRLLWGDYDGADPVQLVQPETWFDSVQPALLRWAHDEQLHDGRVQPGDLDLAAQTDEPPEGLLTRLREHLWAKVDGYLAEEMEDRQADLTRFYGALTEENFRRGLERGADIKEILEIVRRLVEKVGPAPLPQPAVVPKPQSYFRGRAEPIQQIIRALGESRIVTVIGPPGMGKSEICRAVADRVSQGEDYPGGVFGADLRELELGQSHLAGLAAKLGVSPTEAKTPTMLGALLPENSLVVLDELDGFVDADPAQTAALLDGIAGAGRARLLVSSQKSSGASGEALVRLSKLRDEDARELFLDRARSKLEGLEPRDDDGALAAILKFLEGMPRAIVMAAANVDSPDLRLLQKALAQSREELLQTDELPHDSVTISLNLAYNRAHAADPAITELFLGIALFPGGIQADSVDEVFGEGSARRAMALFKRSLIERTALEAYYVPSILRSFAERRRNPEFFESIAWRATKYLAKRTNSLDRLLIQGQSGFDRGLAGIAVELPNAKAFWSDWAFEHESAVDADEDGSICWSARGAASLANALQFLSQDGSLRELLFRPACSAATRLGDRLGEANTRQVLGDVLKFRQELESAEEQYGQALTLFQAIGSRLGEANTRKALGDVLQFRQELESAEEQYGQALTLFQAIGSRLGEANTRKALGDVLQFRQELESAEEQYGQALMLFQAIGERLGEANTRQALGELKMPSEEGLREIFRARELYVEIEDQAGQANTSMTLARFLAAAGQFEAATGEMQPAVDFCERINHPLAGDLRQEIAEWQAKAAEAAARPGRGDTPPGLRPPDAGTRS